jgi:hypothetical protein
MIAILAELRWNVCMVLICISFMARDGEHIFTCSFFFLPFGLLLLKKFCLVHLFTSLLVHWFLGSIVL